MKKRTRLPRRRSRSGRPWPGGAATATFTTGDLPPPQARPYVLRLFVTGSSPRSSAAIATIRSVCDEYLTGNYELEVVDIYQRPAVAVREQIVAAPTLIKQEPQPVRRMIGTLADRGRVLRGLDIISEGGSGPAAIPVRQARP